MRIGEFSKKHDISIDSIRHYMDMGLVLPQKEGSHFNFDEGCSFDIEEIKRLKKLKFSLSEIQKLFIARRITNLEDDENRDYYRRIFLNKKSSLINEREQIDKMIAEIDYRIETIVSKTDKGVGRLGVPLGSLSIFHCPKCKGFLKLNSTQIDDNMIIDGKLVCNCGLLVRIEDGIIILGSEDIQDEQVDSDVTVQEYMESTAPEYINFMYKTIEWIVRRVDSKLISNSVILEPGTGTGYLLRQFNGMLPDDSIYIAVDNNIKVLKYVKSYLETHSTRSGYIFLCCDFTKVPIRDNAIDLVFDFYGSSNYNFSKNDFLARRLSHMVKPEGEWYGVHFCLDKYSRTVMQYPPECRPYFYKDVLIQEFLKSDFKMIDTADLGCVNKAGEFEPFFIEGDKLYALAYHGRKTLG